MGSDLILRQCSDDTETVANWLVAMCKGAAFTGPYLSASGSIRRSTGTGGQSMQRSRGDASDLLAGNDSDSSVQDFVPPSMQVHTDTIRVHILYQNNKKSHQSARIVFLKLIVCTKNIKNAQND